jgi:hypothetical protein
MSYKLKTLIVFDTNSLRRVDGAEVIYSSFSFGKPYETVNEYLKTNNLLGDVTIAVSSLVIDEIKLQMGRSYSRDLQKLKETKKRLGGLPHIDDKLIGIPDDNFDSSKYIEEKSSEYLNVNNNVKLLSFKEEQSAQILQSLISRVHYTKPPFFKTSQNSDAGFKDSIIWETLLNYEDVKNYDKVILVTKDKGFEGCEEEFITKWNRHFKIISAPEAVNTELGNDYQNYLEFRPFFDYAEKEYFQNYFRQELNEKTFIQLDGEDIKIENYKIENYCEKVESKINEEEQEIEYVIHSKATIAITRKGQKENILVNAEFLMNDVFELYEVTFEPNIF